jgi:hypothetical protein
MQNNKQAYDLWYINEFAGIYFNLQYFMMRQTTYYLIIWWTILIGGFLKAVTRAMIGKQTSIGAAASQRP